MNKISRKGFLKIAAAAAMSGVTAGALAACNAASGSTSTAASGSAAASGATGTYIPGTYEGTAEGISSTVKVTMTFSDSAVTDVVVDTSGETASIGAAAADELRDQLLAAGSAEHGFFVFLKYEYSVDPPIANSSIFSFPKSIIFSLLSFSITVAS